MEKKGKIDQQAENLYKKGVQFVVNRQFIQVLSLSLIILITLGTEIVSKEFSNQNYTSNSLIHTIL